MSSPPRRPPRLVLTGAILAALAVVSACGPAPGDDGRRHGLLQLTGSADGQAMLRLTTVEDGVTTMAGVPLPDPATTWVAAGGGGVLAATTADGTLHVSTSLRPGRVPAWIPVEATDPSGDPPPVPLQFPTWDPEGGRLATLGQASDGGGDAAVLIDPTTAGAVAFPITEPTLTSPPAWIDGDRLVVLAGDRDAPTSALLDVQTGETAPGPSGAGRVSTSTDGRMVATWAGPGHPVVVTTTSAWLAATPDESAGTIEPPDADARLASMALDATGQRLAIAWALPDGSVSIDVHAATDGWDAPESERIAGTPGAVVAWLR